jgi:hypothetical protein
VKTVLFDSRDSFLIRQSLMHLYFQKNPDRNIIPVSVFHDYGTYNEYKHLDNTELLAHYWDAGHRKYNKSMLKKLEEKYNSINFWNIVASDRFIKNWKEEEIIKQISFYIYAWETILERYKPDFVVSETISGLWNYFLLIICKRNNIKYLSVLTTKNTGRYYYSTDQFGSWQEFERKYKEILSRGLNQVEMEAATEFIRKFREKPIVPPFMKFMTAFPNFIKFINFPRFFINLRKDIIQNWIHKNHDYKLGYRLSEYGSTLTRARRIIYSRLMKLFKKPDLDNQYLLFPVHFQPEATTEIWAPYYSNQVFTIKSIARSLPFGFYLYVKEHSAVLGSKPIKFYNEIRKIPNVRLIDPFSSIYELINHSKAVIVITNTTGLESIILNKPTIVFGNVFYNLYPFINRVNNINDLPGIIKNAIEQKISEDSPERLAFAYLYCTMGYKSDIYTYRPDDKEIIGFINELLEEISKQ